MCVTDERIREVTGVLENTTEDNRTIIFAAKKEDIIKLYKVTEQFSVLHRKNMSQFTTKPTIWQVRPGKTQMSPVFDVCSMGI